MGSHRCTVAIFLCCLAMTGAAHAEDPCAEGHIAFGMVKDEVLNLHWSGTIGHGMDERIADEFEKAKHRVKAVALELSSCGGSISSKNRTVTVLRTIKQTHDLRTVVRHGDLCASACVSIFLEGSRRIAALTSSWLFHEPTRRDSVSLTGARITEPEATEQMLREIAAVNGVSKRWLKRLRNKIKGAEWWQTGRDLWEAKSGIVTEVLGNSVLRDSQEQDLSAVASTCILCSDPLISYGQRPRPEYRPDPMDMIGIPRR